jgi:prolyl 4-hydroxylase
MDRELMTGRQVEDQDGFPQRIAVDNQKLHLPDAQKIPTDLAELYLLDDFLSQQECERLTTLIKSRLRKSTTRKTDRDEAANSINISNICNLSSVYNPFVRDIDDRICRTMGINASYSEGIQGQYQPADQEFKTHADNFERDQLASADIRGQRTYTFMVYLTDVAEGGETDFEKLGVAIKPKRGQALIWNNLDPRGMPNPNIMHHARPVVGGSQCIITQRFRANGAGPMPTKDRTETTRPETTEDHAGHPISPAPARRWTDPFGSLLMQRGASPAPFATSPASLSTPWPEPPQLPTHPAATAGAGTSTADPRFRLSKYLCRHEWQAASQATHVLVAHPFMGTRASLASDAAAVLDLFAAGPVSLAAVQSQADAPADVTSNLFGYFLQQGFVVPEHADEQQQFLFPFREQDAKQQLIKTTQRGYRTDVTLTLQDFASPQARWHEAQDLRVLILGGCLTQIAADELDRIGPGRGFLVSVTASWPGSTPDFTSIDPHLVVWQPATTGMLGPLWDELPFLDDDEIEQRIKIMCNAVDARLATIILNCRNRLLLVHNFSTPPRQRQRDGCRRRKAQRGDRQITALGRRGQHLQSSRPP